MELVLEHNKNSKNVIAPECLKKVACTVFRENSECIKNEELLKQL